LFARPSVVPQQVFVLATNDKTSVQPVAINNVELNQTIDVSLTPKTELACICDEKSSQPGGSWNAALADRFKVVYQTNAALCDQSPFDRNEHTGLTHIPLTFTRLPPSFCCTPSWLSLAHPSTIDSRRITMGTPEGKMWERLASAVLPPHPDPRTDAYPLMGSWPPTALISLAYVVGVYAWRNELLKKRCKVQQKGTNSSTAAATKDMQTNSWGFVKCLMVLYNFIMVLYSAYMVIGTLGTVSKLGYGLGCEAQPDPYDRRTDSLLYFGYLFYFSKFVEMLDTVFFLWRGKVDQVTFLHVFHHATMPPSIWWGIRYAPGKSCAAIWPTK
ncbi:hypothetical protein X801_06942, partial [Opisthorchis viverrini]